MRSHKCVVMKLKREFIFAEFHENEMRSRHTYFTEILMKKLTLVAATALALSFTAVPAFAQSSYGGNTGNSYGNAAESRAKAEARKAEREARKLAKAQKKQAKADAKKAAAEKAAMKDHSSATDAKAMKDHSSATNGKAMKDHSSATDAKAMKDHSSAAGEPMMKHSDAMQKSSTGLPTNCPPATTPQPNGTCMLN